MQSLVFEPPTEREKRENLALDEKQIKAYPCSMSQYGQLDEDTPVMIPIVPTNFILQQPVSTQQCSHSDRTSGVPPLPSGRYKKHSSDPTRNNPHLSPISSSSSLSRSKSCGEGRSSEPSDAFDVLSRKAGTERLGSGAPLIDKSTQDSTSHYRDDGGFEPPKTSTAGNFKCNVFCVSLPGLSTRKKPMQVRSESHLSSNSVEGDNISKNNMYVPDLEINAAPAARPSIISKVASLERFDLSSVSSDIVIDCWDERYGSSYFDLPMELISSGEDDTDLPVNSAFVFENDRKTGRHKKKSSSSRIASSKTSYEMSSRRSKNSRTSSSSKVSDASTMRSSRSSCSSACIVPKIMKAREELDTLIEAQNT